MMIKVSVAPGLESVMVTFASEIWKFIHVNSINNIKYYNTSSNLIQYGAKTNQVCSYFCRVREPEQCVCILDYDI